MQINKIINKLVSHHYCCIYATLAVQLKVTPAFCGGVYVCFLTINLALCVSDFRENERNSLNDKGGL